MLKETNLKKIDEKLIEIDLSYKKYKRKAKSARKNLLKSGCFHIILAGILGIYIVFGPIFGYALSSAVVPALLGILISCFVSSSIIAINKIINENRLEKCIQRKENFENMKNEYLKPSGKTNAIVTVAQYVAQCESEETKDAIATVRSLAVEKANDSGEENSTDGIPNMSTTESTLEREDKSEEEPTTLRLAKVKRYIPY